MTLRQLHYAIFSRNEISYQNDISSYKRLSRVTSEARRRYRKLELDGDGTNHDSPAIPYFWIVDETRQPETVPVWTDASYVDTVKRGYRRNGWQDQKCYCEIWAEKATILGAIHPIAKRWAVTSPARLHKRTELGTPPLLYPRPRFAGEGRCRRCRLDLV